jgi:RHS repeat-associated protein
MEVSDGAEMRSRVTVEHPPSSRFRRTGARAAADTLARRNLDEGGWLHYDQVGSVLSESDADGDLVATHYQDAFGVRQADWETGLPGGTREGWAHNTKEIDGDTGLMYMYQRWYVPEYGQFMSRSPYSPRSEHPWTAFGQNPAMYIDPDGEAYYKPCSWFGGDCSVWDAWFDEMNDDLFGGPPSTGAGVALGGNDFNCARDFVTGDLECCWSLTGTLIGVGGGASTGTSQHDFTVSVGLGKYAGIEGGDGTIGGSVGFSIGAPVCPNVKMTCVTFGPNGVPTP